MQSKNNLLFFFLHCVKINNAILDQEIVMVPVQGFSFPFYTQKTG